jgi:hypothetical protein
MRILVITAAALVSLSGCTSDGNYQRVYRGWRNYDYNRPDPAYGAYYPDKYYRDNSRRERRLSGSERIYRGQDDRYYCRRSDGTTGLIVGAIVGGALGNRIARGGSETLGTLLGAGAGAVAGQAIDSGTRCR